MNTEPQKIYDYVMAQFDAKTVPQTVVAEETGIPYSTVTKIAQRVFKNPSVHNIQVLADYFLAQQQKAAFSEPLASEAKAAA